MLSRLGRRARLLSLLGTVFGCAILLLLLSQVDLALVMALSLGQVAGIVLVIVAGMGLTLFEAARLQVLAQAGFTLWEVLQVVLIGYFVANFTPSSFGGDGFKMYAIGRRRGYSEALALIILERALGLAVLLAVSLPIIVLGGWVGEFIALAQAVDISALGRGEQIVLAAVALSLTLLLLALRRPVLRFCRRFLGALRSVTIPALCMSLLFALCLHIGRAALLCLVLLTLGQGQVDMGQAWVALAFATVASLLPLSPGGLGIREAAIVIMLQAFGVDASTAIIASLVFRLIIVCQAAVGAALSAKAGGALVTAR